MHVLLHPGFHKTGTSSLQRALVVNHDLLADRLRYVVMTDMPDPVQAARRYSKKPSPANLDKFRNSFTDLLTQLGNDDPRPLLITSEELSGIMPGKFDITAYDASPLLMLAAVSAIRDLWGTEPKIDIYYTTRAPRAWQRSNFYQTLRMTRRTEDFEDFATATTRAAQLDDIVAETARVVEHEATVASGRLEDSAASLLGPLGAFLTHYGFSTDGLPELPVENAQPAGLADELLAINRSDLDDDAASEAKRQAIRQFRKRARAGEG